jgi:hypothetical protein
VFALLFFKPINDVYLEELRNLTERLGDAEPAKDPRMHNFVVPDDVLWDKGATKPRNELGTASAARRSITRTCRRTCPEMRRALDPQLREQGRHVAVS